ncbi:ATP-binding cassette domain-containing protein [Streptomyces sp. Je 1-79]|uniref:ATP-binding cassette domain-containing protein n=1 Tax=Streptomyces sp. Je 1-79 TaxID=2943847 RepID=UPI0021A2C59C|nr:ATP-binding cassette domain-containing protein [Streptomyces sp. Je 1-79]MCT4355248.1 ATP-binding cassette domain-containing protein [Streptomyces sp. Je 1-79]
MEANPEEPHGAAVVADGFGLKGPRGWVFRGVGFRAEPGALVAIEGPSGSGRTCLLLALTGRMKPQEGHAEVAGLPLPRRMAAVRRISALGPVPGVSDLDPALTVAEHLRERALLQRRYDGAVRALLRPPGERAAATRARIDAALEASGLDLDALPKGERTSVRDLERLEALRLSVALALIGRPRLLALDDADLKLSAADRAEAWALLRSIADAGTTVLAVCSEAPEDALRVTTTPRAADDATEDTADGADGADTDDADDTDSATEDTADGAAADATGAAAEDATEDTTEEGEADALAETGRA